MSKFSNDTSTVGILHSIATPQTNDSDLEHKSIITGKRHFVKIKELQDWDVTVFLFKFSNQSEVLTQLKQYENSLVCFAPYDEEYIINTQNDKVKYYFENIKKYSFDGFGLLPVLILKLRACEGHTNLFHTDIKGYGHHYGKYYGRGW